MSDHELAQWDISPAREISGGQHLAGLRVDETGSGHLDGPQIRAVPFAPGEKGMIRGEKSLDQRFRPPVGRCRQRVLDQDSVALNVPDQQTRLGTPNGDTRHELPHHPPIA